MKLQSPFAALLSIALFAFSFGFLFYRLHFGVDFFDEPFYSALCLRLFSGQALLKDELNLASGFSLLSYPFFWAYTKLSGSLEGIILFMRYCFFVLYFALGIGVFSFVRKGVPKPLAISVSACTICFFPFNILTLSYNTLGILFLTLSLFLLWSGVSSGRRLLWIASGFFLGLSSLSYVSFLGVGAFVLAWSFLLKRKELVWLYLGLGLLLAWIYPLLFLFRNQEALFFALDFAKQRISASSSGLEVFRVLHKLFPKQVLFPLFCFYFLSWILKRHSLRGFEALVSLIPAVALLFTFLSTHLWSVYPVYFGALSLVVWGLGADSSFRVSLFKWIFLPSCIAGILSALFSATRHLNAQVGLVPAVLASLLCLADFLQGSYAFKKRQAIQVLLVGLPVFFVMLYPLNIWDDSSWPTLTAKVRSGPFKGIYTHSEKREMAEEIYSALHPRLQGKGPLLIFPNFSAGYLMSFMPPARGTTWYENSGLTNSILAALYKSQLNPGSRVLRMKTYYGTPTMKSYPSFSKEDPLNGFVETTHEVELETDWFTLWKPRS